MKTTLSADIHQLPPTHRLKMRCPEVRADPSGVLLDVPPLEVFCRLMDALGDDGVFSVGAPRAVDGHYECDMWWTRPHQNDLVTDEEPAVLWASALRQEAASLRHNARLEKPLPACELGIPGAHMSILCAIARLSIPEDALGVIAADGTTTTLLPPVRQEHVAALPPKMKERRVHGRLTAVGLAASGATRLELNWRTMAQVPNLSLADAYAHLANGAEVRGRIREVEGVAIFEEIRLQPLLIS